MSLKVAYIADKNKREFDRKVEEMAAMLLEKWRREAPARWKRRKAYYAKKKALAATDN